MIINKKFNVLAASIFTIFFSIISCSSPQKVELKNDTAKIYKSEKQKLSVSPAFDGIDVPFLKYKVKPEDSQTIRVLKTGTAIEIPSDAFVDAEGNTIKTEVEIAFREFHDAAEIIASGIPMQNPETGEYMETAGMFEIRGKCNGKEIFINPQKKINVKLATYNAGNKFDFFKLDNDGRWETLQKNSEPIINLIKTEELSKAKNKSPKKPVMPIKFGKTTKFVFDLNADYSKFADLKIFKDVIWQFAGSPGDADNPEKNPELFNKNWTGIEIIREGDHYKLLLSNNKEKHQMRVQPVLKGNDYNKAMAEFNVKMKQYDKARAEMAQIQKMYEQQADFQRDYAVNGFGIYNWDYWKSDTDKMLEVSIDLESDYDYFENSQKLVLYLINNNRKAVVKYHQRELVNFKFPTNEKNKLICILPGNKIATFGENDFKKLSTLKNGEKAVLKMKTSDKEIKSVEGISDAIAMF